jgi:hypothetical protein
MTDPAIEGMRLAATVWEGPWCVSGLDVITDHDDGAPVKAWVCSAYGTAPNENPGRSEAFKRFDATAEFIAHAGTHYASICKRAVDAEAKVAAMARVVEAAVKWHESPINTCDGELDDTVRAYKEASRG